MSNYAVADPQIDEVIDVDTGEYLPAAKLIGSDYGQVMQLRMSLRTDIVPGLPKYGCALCGVPVVSSASPRSSDELAQECAHGSSTDSRARQPIAQSTRRNAASPFTVCVSPCLRRTSR